MTMRSGMRSAEHTSRCSFAMADSSRLAATTDTAKAKQQQRKDNEEEQKGKEKERGERGIVGGRKEGKEVNAETSFSHDWLHQSHPSMNKTANWMSRDCDRKGGWDNTTGPRKDQQKRKAADSFIPPSRFQPSTAQLPKSVFAYPPGHSRVAQKWVRTRSSSSNSPTLTTTMNQSRGSTTKGKRKKNENKK